jgi:hypothetical protein
LVRNSQEKNRLDERKILFFSSLPPKVKEKTSPS